MHPLELSLLEQFPRQRWHDTRILVAVSGGADSVALLRSLCRITASPHLLDVAHFNHRWRGSESDDDQAFVQAMCHDLGVQLHLGFNYAGSNHAAVTPPVSGATVKRSEESARDARYAFLAQTAYRIGARYVLTAHTASDRVETLLHNLFRGTGLAGVAAPLSVRVFDEELVLIRPLLNCTRQSVEDYLNSLGQTSLSQTFRTDSSNADERYRRNFLRRSLLPMLRETYGDDVDQRLCSFSAMAEEIVQYHRRLASEYRERSLAMWLAERTAVLSTHESTPDASRLVIKELAIAREHHLPTPWPIVFQNLQWEWQQREWPLQSMSRNHWNQLRAAWSKPKDADWSKPMDTAWSESKDAELSSTVARSRSLVDQLPSGLSVQQFENWLVVSNVNS